jgi:hypothetical protein
VASSRQDLDQVLRDTAEGRELLMAGLCELLWERGIRPGPGQCYGYKVPPVLGAPVSWDNVQLWSLALCVSLQGQLLHRLEDPQPISKVVVKTSGEA